MELKVFKLFSLFFLALTSYDHATALECTKQGTFCSDDCSGIVACVESGSDPIPIHTCDNTDTGLFCQVGEEGATCNQATATCSGASSSLKIICGSVGELPHPALCGSTVRCTSTGPEAVPEEQCTCPTGNFIDIMRPSLPCKSGECPREAVKCDSAGQFGQIGEGSDFQYICVDEESLIVFVSDAEDTKRNMLELRASPKKVCDAYQPPEEGSGDGGDDGGNGEQ